MHLVNNNPYSVMSSDQAASAMAGMGYMGAHKTAAERHAAHAAALAARQAKHQQHAAHAARKAHAPKGKKNAKAAKQDNSKVIGVWKDHLAKLKSSYSALQNCRKKHGKDRKACVASAMRSLPGRAKGLLRGMAMHGLNGYGMGMLGDSITGPDVNGNYFDAQTGNPVSCDPASGQCTDQTTGQVVGTVMTGSTYGAPPAPGAGGMPMAMPQLSSGLPTLPTIKGCKPTSSSPRCLLYFALEQDQAIIQQLISAIMTMESQIMQVLSQLQQDQQPGGPTAFPGAIDPNTGLPLGAGGVQYPYQDPNGMPGGYPQGDPYQGNYPTPYGMPPMGGGGGGYMPDPSFGGGGGGLPGEIDVPYGQPYAPMYNPYGGGDTSEIPGGFDGGGDGGGLQVPTQDISVNLGPGYIPGDQGALILAASGDGNGDFSTGGGDDGMDAGLVAASPFYTPYGAQPLDPNAAAAIAQAGGVQLPPVSVPPTAQTQVPQLPAPAALQPVINPDDQGQIFAASFESAQDMGIES